MKNPARFLLIAMTVMTAATAPSVLQAAPEPPTGEVDVDSGLISGYITDIDTGLPVVGAHVRIFDAVGTMVTELLLSGGNHLYFTLDPGVYYFAVHSAPGHLPQLFREIAIDPAGYDPTSGDPVVVQSGVTTRHIDFRLTATGAITGIVTDANTGMPLDNLEVRVFAADGSPAGNYAVEWQGWYRIGNLAPGSYTVGTAVATYWPHHVDQLHQGIPCPGGVGVGCDPTTGTPVGVGPGSLVSVDFALPISGTIMGGVTSAYDGRGLPFLDIKVWDQAGNLVYNDENYNSGLFQIPGLEDGAYSVSVSNSDDHVDQLWSGIPCPGGPPQGCDPTTGTLVIVAAGQPPAEVDFVLDQLGMISGTITDDITGYPLGSAEVSAYSLPGFTYAGDADAHLASGTYHIRGLEPGEYVIKARDHDALDELFDNIPCENGNCDFTMGTPIVTHLNTDTQGIDFALRQITGSLSGTVVDESTGAPINEAWVSLYGSGGGQPSGRYTDEFGAYFFGSVLPGDYYVFVEVPFTGYLEELWDDIPCPDGPGNGCVSVPGFRKLGSWNFLRS